MVADVQRYARACVRREGDRAAKNRAQIETCERAGRQEAPGCAEEAERAADHGRRGGQHVQGGRKRVALQRSKRWVEFFSSSSTVASRGGIGIGIAADDLPFPWRVTGLKHFIGGGRLGTIVHAAVSANTFAIYGVGQVKELTELVPGILNQLGPDSLASLRKLAESYQAIQQGQQRAGAGAADDDDDDVPDLVENFDVEEKKDNTLEELN